MYFLLKAIAMNIAILFYPCNTGLFLTSKYNGIGFHLHNLSRSHRLKVGSKLGNEFSRNFPNSGNLINQ